MTQRDIVFVTGPSGAGLSTATDTLEDVGFEAIDNLPLRLVLPVVEAKGPSRPLSLSFDLRNRDFDPQRLIELLEDLDKRQDVKVQLLYLDCRPDVIINRYSSTRRRHPVGDAPTLAEGVAFEIEQLGSIRDRADVLIDTSELNPHQLRAEIEQWIVPHQSRRIAVQVQSFSYKRGLPRGADMVFDCRFLSNPHWDENLRPLDGRSPDVQNFVENDTRYATFFKYVKDMSLFVLPAVQEEGKSYFTIAFGCSGGKHRSVTLAERLTHALAEQGWQVSTRHRELKQGPTEESRN